MGASVIILCNKWQNQEDTITPPHASNLAEYRQKRMINQGA